MEQDKENFESLPEFLHKLGLKDAPEVEDKKYEIKMRLLKHRVGLSCRRVYTKIWLLYSLVVAIMMSLFGGWVLSTFFAISMFVAIKNNIQMLKHKKQLKIAEEDWEEFDK